MSKAYVVDVGKNSDDSHQMNPAYMLTFVRWTNRDTLRMQSSGSEGDLGVTKPMVVINDCVSLTTSMAKSQQTPSVNMVLRAGDINYETAVAPGDFVFVNMILDDDKRKDGKIVEGKLQDLYDRASSGKHINGKNDGFKGFYKIQSVRRTISVDPNSGTKIVFFRIDGFAFTEFNNNIYFNPYLVNDPKFAADAIYSSNIGLDYKQFIDSQKEKCGASVEFTLRFFIEKFLGRGNGEMTTTIKNSMGKREVQTSQNSPFKVPSLTGSLLGIKAATAEGLAAKDLYTYLFGIQNYDRSDSLESGMNPLATNSGGRFFLTGQGCQGNVLLKPEYWNQVPVWSILRQYINAPINELYPCFRVSPEGFVVPTLVLRQIPFSTEAYGGTCTKFLNLPRWKIDPELIYDLDIGRDEAAKINFVQVFGIQGGIEKPDANVSFQIARGNYVADTADITRAGLRPYVLTSSFDWPNVKGDSLTFHAPTWARLLADSLVGGHLKMNGTVTCAGIQAPIACGDNFEIDGIVYHIESVMHTMSIDSSGKKKFRTTLQLSNGIDKSYTAKQPRYADMEFTDIELERQKQFANDQLFNGFSDEQILPDRKSGIKLKSHNNSFLLPKRKTAQSPSNSKVDKKSKRLIK